MKYLSTLLLFCTVSILWSCSSTKTESSETDNIRTPIATEKMDYNEAFQGAWTTSYFNDKNEEVTISTIVIDGYMAEAFYNKDAKKFDRTLGGSWNIEENNFNLTFEFDTGDSTMVGKTGSLAFKLKNDKITFKGDDNIWTRIDDGKPGALAGAYLITGRKRDGEISKRTPGARKTMKILSGTRFQWIAYNTETAKFSGTGGGTYTTIDGKYRTLSSFLRMATG